MPLPKKISPCPILESIVELRFESNIPSDAIFGIIYDKFKDELPSVKKLPILQLPEQIRTQDPALQFLPLYQIFNDDFIMQIGPKTISLVNKPKEPGNYVGWEGGFSNKLKLTFQEIVNLNIVSKVTRLGIRYTNFFPTNVFELINLTVNLNGNAFKTTQTTLRSVIKTGNFVSTLLIDNGAQLTEPDAIRKGSILDIDTYIGDGQESIEIGKLNALLDEGHSEEKKLFFELLKPEYLKTLNPIYD